MIDTRLQKILNEMVVVERQKKKARHKGIVIKKKITKNNNILFVIKKPKYEIATLVNKNKSELFKTAESVKLNDIIYVEGDKGIDIVWCDKIEVLSRCSEQVKLK